MRRWSDLLCAFPNAATAGAENATINAKATRSLLMMLSFYDVNFHAWIIKGDSMGARFYSDHGRGCAITFPCNAA